MQRRKRPTFLAESVPALRRLGRVGVAACRVGAALFQDVAFSVVTVDPEFYPVWQELRERRPALLRPDGFRRLGDRLGRVKSRKGWATNGIEHGKRHVQTGSDQSGGSDETCGNTNRMNDAMGQTGRGTDAQARLAARSHVLTFQLRRTPQGTHVELEVTEAVARRAGTSGGQPLSNTLVRSSPCLPPEAVRLGGGYGEASVSLFSTLFCR